MTPLAKGNGIMKRILGFVAGLSTLAILGAGCAQPRIDCTTGHGGFAAKYTLKAGSKSGEGTCDTLKGEIIGLEKYNLESAEEREEQDLTKAKLAIRTTKLGQMVADAE